MNFNKCKRCGCFFISDADTCPSCSTKDNNDLSKLNTYFSENDNNLNEISINELSSITGISSNTIKRCIANSDFDYKKQIKL